MDVSEFASFGRINQKMLDEKENGFNDSVISLCVFQDIYIGVQPFKDFFITTENV